MTKKFINYGFELVKDGEILNPELPDFLLQSGTNSSSLGIATDYAEIPAGATSFEFKLTAYSQPRMIAIFTDYQEHTSDNTYNKKYLQIKVNGDNEFRSGRLRILTEESLTGLIVKNESTQKKRLYIMYVVVNGAIVSSTQLAELGLASRFIDLTDVNITSLLGNDGKFLKILGGKIVKSDPGDISTWPVNEDFYIEDHNILKSETSSVFDCTEEPLNGNLPDSTTCVGQIFIVGKIDESSNSLFVNTSVDGQLIYSNADPTDSYEIILRGENVWVQSIGEAGYWIV